MYAQKPLKFFLDKLCSESPEPGGGSASALTGATAASLAGMLSALTVSNKKYQQVSGEMKDLLNKAGSLKDQLLELLQEDTEAFEDAARAFKMPKTTQEEKKARARAIDRGLKKATEVPLSIMEKCLEVGRLASVAVKKGNQMAISDGAISALFAEAAAKGAMVNVRINFSWLKDRQYIEETEKKLGAVLDELKVIRREAMSYTLEKLKKD
ncbi:MAG: cyclodeaminase/cyclohydrolase family protein [Spirochaetota bacterium]